MSEVETPKVATSNDCQVTENSSINNDTNSPPTDNNDTSQQEVVEQKIKQENVEEAPKSNAEEQEHGDEIAVQSDAGANNSNSLNDSTEDENKTNLIVNYLPQLMTDEQFDELFKKFGNRKSCKIVRNRVTGYSYGFGFVDFETHEEALKAIEELNGHEMEGKKIKVAFARPAGQDIKQANLYIKNVPASWGQDEVRKIFEPHGDIIQVRVLGDRGIAFVLFDLRKQAEAALEALNGKTLEGCEEPLEIKFAADKKTEKSGNKNQSSNSNDNTRGTGTETGRRRERGHRGGRNRNRNRNNANNQKSFFDSQRDQQGRQRGGRGNGTGQNQYNSSKFDGNGVGPMHQQAGRGNRFAPYMPVHQPMQMQPNPAAVAPMAAHPNPYGYAGQPQQMIPYMMSTAPMMTMNPAAAPMGQTSGQTMPMGMPSLGSYQAAQIPLSYAPIAQNTLNNMYSMASNTMNNAANMQPQIGQPMNMMRMNNNGQSNNSISNNNNNSSGGGDGVTLFVYNIGPESSDEELRLMFQPYGQIVKCNVVRKTPGGETKGFGFVTMKERSQANAAIAGLDGSMRTGRVLQVSLKKQY